MDASRKADSILNHTLKNTMADAAGEIEMFLQNMSLQPSALAHLQQSFAALRRVCDVAPLDFPTPNRCRWSKGIPNLPVGTAQPFRTCNRHTPSARQRLCKVHGTSWGGTCAARARAVGL